ncbi:hypothetical protein Tco_0906143, partial [Tanacetum coccineum]
SIDSTLLPLLIHQLPRGEYERKSGNCNFSNVETVYGVLGSVKEFFKSILRKASYAWKFINDLRLPGGCNEFGEEWKGGRFAGYGRGMRSAKAALESDTKVSSFLYSIECGVL